MKIVHVKCKIVHGFSFITHVVLALSIKFIKQMKKQKTTYALTGVTGLLGRNVFFEILKDNLKNLNTIEIIILGRSSGHVSLKERIKMVFYEEGINYLSTHPDYLSELDSFLNTKMTYVTTDLSLTEAITVEEKKKLSKKTIDYFFHIAANTDFRDGMDTIESLNTQNVEGTAQILKLCEGLDIKSFGYVSSAYACGCTYGNVQPDYTNLNQNFRNHYEKTKLQGELLVRDYQKRSGVTCRIFRPSTISGKLLEDKKGEIYKFDVFYSCAHFFLKLKQRSYTGNIDNIYDEKVEMNIRIAVNFNAGLNIVPVDFASKVLYHVCKNDIEGSYFHLVNNEETSTTSYLGQIMKMLNITGYEFVDEIPEDLNPLEKFFYKSIGRIFTPYFIQDEINFATTNLQEFYTQQNLHCPKVDEENFQILLEYAKTRHFGLAVT